MLITLRIFRAVAALSLFVVFACNSSSSVTSSAGDRTAPVITTFLLPVTSSTLLVTGIVLAAVDDVGVTGYYLSSDPVTPAVSAVGWSAVAPVSFTFTSPGNMTLYAWAKDDAGNVSAPQSASVTITLATDNTAPFITTFFLPVTSSTLLVTGIVLAAVDDVGVTGYYLSSDPVTPAVSAAGWSAVAPASFTFTSPGNMTLYAWAKDAAGNVSARQSAGVTITLPTDNTAPSITIFLLPDTSSTLLVTGIVLAAVDDVGVTGYYLSSNPVTPAVSAAGWSAVAPASYSFTSPGIMTLYAWTKDAAGNVSARQSASVTITLVTAEAPSAVFEVNMAGAGTTSLRSPWDTWAVWIPEPVSPLDATNSPMIRYVAFFNATGGMPALPGNELYDEDAAGNPVYHFERLTSKIDSVLAAGFKPYIVLSYTPVKLARDPAALSPEFGTNTSPPRDWNKYYNYIKAFFENLNVTYGAGEVASWRFRCGTEPDNSAWWSGTMEEWFTFYDYTIAAARAANPNVNMRITINPGNYMSSASPLVAALAARIQAGSFSISGESPVVPSVISFSYYQADPSKITTAVNTIRSALAPYPKFAGIPLSIDEGYINNDENGAIMYSRLDGTEYGGAHFALLTTTMVEQNILWGALWNTGAADVPPPARNVLDLFQQLMVGGTRLELTKVYEKPLNKNVVGGLAVHPAGAPEGRMRLMLFNYNALRAAAGDESLLVRVRGVPTSGVKVTWYRIDRNHANYSARWLADSAGIPRNAYTATALSPYDLNPTDGVTQEGIALWTTNKFIYAALSKVVAESEQTVRLPTADGTLEIRTVLPSHGVVFVKLDPVE